MYPSPIQTSHGAEWLLALPVLGVFWHVVLLSLLIVREGKMCKIT